MGDELDITRAEGEGMPPVELASPLPCPFCGAPPNVVAAEGTGGRTVWYLKCTNDACDVIVEIACQPSRELAVALWNRRA